MLQDITNDLQHWRNTFTNKWKDTNLSKHAMITLTTWHFALSDICNDRLNARTVIYIFRTVIYDHNIWWNTLHSLHGMGAFLTIISILTVYQLTGTSVLIQILSLFDLDLYTEWLRNWLGVIYIYSIYRIGVRIKPFIKIKLSRSPKAELHDFYTNYLKICVLTITTFKNKMSKNTIKVR